MAVMRKVIVLGGSAGGIPALCALLDRLPADLPAALLAVIHLPEGESFLPEVLQRRSRLKIVSPKEPEPISSGRLYVGLPNRHLVIRNGCVAALSGPRENRHRPAVDALFRSAARAYRSKVVAVVLSGAQDDGSAGALAVKARGGTVIVQEPAEAQASDMPRNVLRHIQTDYCLPLAEIAALLIKLCDKGPKIARPRATRRDCEAVAAEKEVIQLVEPMNYSCPDCGGSVMKIKDGNLVQY